MISLISLLFDAIRDWEPIAKRFNDPLVHVRRFPATKALRIQVLGLTLGFIFAALSLTVHDGMFIQLSLISILIILIFFLGTMAGGLFVFLNIVYVWLVRIDVIQPAKNSVWMAFDIMAVAFLSGYFIGVILSVIYNDLVYIHTMTIGKSKNRFSFVYNTRRKLNIIKQLMVSEEKNSQDRSVSPLSYLAHQITNNHNAEENERKFEVNKNIRNLAVAIRKGYRRMTRAQKEKLAKKLPKEMGKSFYWKLQNLKKELNRYANGEPPAYKITLSELLANMEPYIQENLQLKGRFQYNYREVTKDYPYTIAFVANPKIQLEKDGPYFRDPIMDDPKLFYRSVDKALASFEQNEVLSRPKIWSQVQVLTIFDEDYAKEDVDGESCALVGWSPAVEIGGSISENLLDPVTELRDNYRNMLLKLSDAGEITEDEAKAIFRSTDVIFALSANRVHDRATAHFTDWIEDGEGYQINENTVKALKAENIPSEVIDRLIDLQNSEGARWVFIGKDRFKALLETQLSEISDNHTIVKIMEMTRIGYKDPNKPHDPMDPDFGIPFDFQLNPNLTKNGARNIAEMTFNDRYTPIHEYYPVNPGRVATNVLTASQKTYIHEFAHAMSSAYHGAIVDEYFDTVEFEKGDHSSNSNPEILFQITDKTLHAMENDARVGPAIPQDLPGFTKTLRQIKDREIFGRGKFLEEIGQLIGEDHAAKYQRFILEHAKIETPFYVNRIENVKLESDKSVPVPKVFAAYERTVYGADMEHPSSEEDWSGYFPDRKSHGFSCTMDRNLSGGYRFDDLISTFIYDRLIAKINRPAFQK